MTAMSREARLNRAFVALADTLTSEFDLVELLQTLVDTCTDVLGVTAGGLLLADRAGQLQLLVSSSEDAGLVEFAQIGAQDGPCFECYQTGTPVTVGDIDELQGRWPDFAAAAALHGFRSVHATPMRLRDDVIGTMNLFGVEPGALDGPDIAVAQALTDVATIGILQERLVRHAQVVADQLQTALTSRVVIEQAKGVLSELGRFSMDEAFQLLRVHARRTNTPLLQVAHGVVDRSIDVLANRR